MKEALYKITENCPGDCLFCDAREKYEKIFKNSTIGLNDWKKISDDLIANGLEIAIISGGEALIERETTFELIDYLKNKGIYVVLNTSGVLFNNNNLLDLLKVNYPDLLVFSVDSAYKDRHDYNRNLPGLFEKIVKSIKYLKKSGDYPIAIRTVITKNNFKELPKIIRDFNKLGVDCIKLTNIENDDEGKFRLNKEELIQFDNEIRSLMIDELKNCKFENEDMRKDAIHKVQNLLSRERRSFDDLAEGIFEPKLIKNAKCPLIERFVTIQSNGIVLPCCESEHHYEPILGNILEKTFSEIVVSEPYKDLLINRPEYCVKCTEWENIQINFTDTAKKVNHR